MSEKFNGIVTMVCVNVKRGT